MPLVYLTQKSLDSNAKVHLDVDCGYLANAKTVIPVEVRSVDHLDLCELCAKPEELAQKRTAWKTQRYAQAYDMHPARLAEKMRELGAYKICSICGQTPCESPSACKSVADKEAQLG